MFYKSNEYRDHRQTDTIRYDNMLCISRAVKSSLIASLVYYSLISVIDVIDKKNTAYVKDNSNTTHRKQQKITKR